MPTGKPSEAPSPQTTMPRPTSTRCPPRITSSVPAAASGRRAPQHRRPAEPVQHDRPGDPAHRHRADEGDVAGHPDPVRDVVPVDERQRQPVVRGALGHGEGQHHDADRQRAWLQPGAAGRRRRGRFLFSRQEEAGPAKSRAPQRGHRRSPRCTGNGTPAAAIGTPIAAPVIPPTDQAAWNRGMIERPSPRSTSAPSTFIATSHTPEPMPNANRPTAQTGTRPNGPAPTPATSRPRRAADAARPHHRAGAPPVDEPARRRQAPGSTRPRSRAAATPAPLLSSDRPAPQVRDPGDQRGEEEAVEHERQDDGVAGREDGRSGQRDQSVPGGRDSSQDWNPVRDSRLIASSTDPCGPAHSTTRWSG